MTVLWPQLLRPVAQQVFAELGTGSPEAATRHPEQVYSPVGGRRAADADVSQLIGRVTECATRWGFPDHSSNDQRIAFDREAAQLVRDCMDLSWSEAGNRAVWSFISLVALPHVTLWRFGIRNVERWVATDLTRHTWARLWWQAVVFERDPFLLTMLAESDLNQLLERRSIGGDPRLVCTVARVILERVHDGGARRQLFRDVTARLRRRLAFIDPWALNDQQLLDLCRALADESLVAHRVIARAPVRDRETHEPEVEWYG